MGISGFKDKPMKATVQGIEMFHKTLPEGQAGDQCGVMLKGVKRVDLARGMVCAQPGTVQVFKKFSADCYILKEDEGGRKKPFFTHYRPQAYIRTGTTTVEVILPDNVEMAMPVEKGLRFALREGGLTVGSGIVTECIE